MVMQCLAKHTRVDYIITGDEDFLILKDFDSISVVNPGDFWNIIKKQKKTRIIEMSKAS